MGEPAGAVQKWLERCENERSWARTLAARKKKWWDVEPPTPYVPSYAIPREIIHEISAVDRVLIERSLEPLNKLWDQMFIDAWKEK